MSSRRYPPSKYVQLVENDELETFSEAMAHMDKKKWLNVIQEEMNSLHENDIYELVALPKRRKALKTSRSTRCNTRRIVYNQDRMQR